MKAMDFIAKDIAKARPRPWLGVLVALAAGALMAAYGLGLRGDFEEVVSPANLVPPLAMTAALAVLLATYLSPGTWKRKAPWLGFSIWGFAVLSFVQPQTPVSLRKFLPPESFWPEALHCFALGTGASLLACAALGLLFWKAWPLPNRRWQRLLALVPGLCGIIALTYHCMGPLWSHVAVAHWGQALLILIPSYALMRAIFRRQTAGLVGTGTGLRDLDEIDR